MALRRVTLRDFVIVQQLELDMHQGFTALTGETGAGKSILIDALQLAMGARADAGFVREGAERADICAEFDLTAPALPLLETYGMDAQADGVILMRRSMDAHGKSRGWINGTPATATQLRELGALLVDIHGQHAWQSLMQASSMRTLLDGYGQIDTAPIKKLWHAWQGHVNQLDAATQGQAQRLQEQERLQWQIAEVDKLAPQADEWAALNSEHQRLAHAQQLLDAAGAALQGLESEEGGILRSLHQITQPLHAQAAIDPAFAEWASLLESSRAQLQEVQRDLHTYLARTELDPARLAVLDQRLASWLTLARRFRQPPEQLATTWLGWQQQLQQLAEEENLQALEQAATQAQQAWQAKANRLTLARQQAATALSHDITTAMQQLGMAGGRFEVCITPATQPGSTGQDTVDFLVAGHAGASARAVAKVASGGELSRLALAIAVTTSKLGQAPTLIFDEIDAGIGGVVAHAVGRLMQQLGHDRQVLAVTHLPQVAACADHHVRVFKTLSHGQATLPISHASTLSSAETLTGPARLNELARMLGGEKLTPTSLAHASEMLAAGHPADPAHAMPAGTSALFPATPTDTATPNP